MSNTAKIFTQITNVDYLQRVRPSKYKELNLYHLAEQLKRGRFNFSSLQMAKIPKSNGKYRIICMPCDKDKFVQRVLLENLSSKDADVCHVHSGISFSGPKKGVAKAIEKALEYMKYYPYYLKVDIVSFFDEIDRELLIKKINKLQLTKSLKKLLIQVVKCELKFSSGEDKKIAEEEGIRRGKGLRQGMPLSPYLADLALKDFDKKLCRLKRIKVIRYCDDMLIFGKTEAGLKKIVTKIERWLCCENLRIHTTGEKQPIISNQTVPIKFLGYVLKKGRAYISNDGKKEIKYRIRSFAKWREQKNKHGLINLYDFVKKMKAVKRGYINAYSMASNKTHLKEMMDKNIGNVLAAVLEDVIGEGAVKNILQDKDKMHFLGLDSLVV